MGMVHHHSEELKSASVTVYIDIDGTITEEFYNLNDYEGDRFFRLPKDCPCHDILYAMLEEARKKARDRKAYADARRRDTKIDNLKFAFCVTEGKHGHMVYVDEEPNCSSTISGYGLDDAERAEVIRLGIPFFDKRHVSDESSYQLISAPMIPSKPGREDKPPWSSLNFAPLAVMAAIYERLGATIYGIKPDRTALDNLAGMTSHERKALVAYETGDEVGLMQAMHDREWPPF